VQPIIYSVSGRNKDPSQTMRRFFRNNFATLDKQTIDMIFAFVETSPLYGGRHFYNPELSPNDVAYLYALNIGLKLPLSNHYVSEQEYEEAAPFLEKYHRDGNAAVVVNDNLAKWMRRDFPKYQLEASVIKNIYKPSQVDKALELYDTVVLPMNICQQPEVLKTFDSKENIRLFANGGCALSCPAHTCYRGFSKDNKFPLEERPNVAVCSKPKLTRPELAVIDFDVEFLHSLGFSKFKLLRVREKNGYQTGF